MKKIILLYIALTVSLAVTAQTKKTIKPIANKNAIEIFYGKSKSYYYLNKSLDFPVENIKKIIIYSRERINSKTKGYSITYNFNNTKTESYFIKKAIIDKKSAYKDKSIQYRVSKLSKKVIEIPKNAKTLHLFTNEKIDIYLKPIKKRKLIKPIQSVQPIKIITGKTAKYYKLNTKPLVELSLKKAGKLYVYTRKRLEKKDSKNYTFSYKVGKLRPVKVNITNAKPSNYAIYKSLTNHKKPSIYHKISINIKENSLITFSALDKVDARFVFKNKWNEIINKKGNRIDLTTKKGNKIRKYYNISKDQNFDFKINVKQKTNGKIYLRGEFTYDMLSNNDYEIILKDYNKVVTTYKLSCHRSKEINYKTNSDKIPGTLDKIFFEIPKGNHHYTISIGNKNKSALVRVLIEN